MKKKMLVIPVLLLAFALISIPVMAAPATKVAVTATGSGTTTGWVTHVSLHGNRVVMQLREGAGTSTITLNLPGGAIAGTGVGQVQGKVLFSQPPPDPDAVCIYQAHMVWTFDGGTFEGIRKSKMIGFGPGIIPYVETSCVLHGTDAFLGQTLKLSYEGPGGGGTVNWVGTLLTPK